MEAKGRDAAGKIESPTRAKAGRSRGNNIVQRENGFPGEAGNNVAEAKDPKYPPQEVSSGRDQVEIPKKNDGAQLSLSGSRTMLAQLRPKGSMKALLQRHERELSDSGADQSTSNSDGDGDGYSSKSSSNLGRSTTAPAPKTSLFRSMVSRGGGSSSAAATAMKGQLDRMPNFRTQDKEAGGGALRFGRGKGSWSDKAESRPPVQHPESLGSEEGGTGGEGGHFTPDNGEGSPGEHRPGLISGGKGTSNSDGKEVLETNRGARAGIIKSSDPTGRMSNQGNEILRRLKPSTRALRWPQNKNLDGNRAKTRAPLSSPPSESSSTTSKEEDRVQIGNLFGRAEGASTALKDKSPLLGRKPTNKKQTGRRNSWKIRGNRLQAGTKGTATISDVPGAPSSGSGLPFFLQKMVPWRHICGWGDSDEANEHAIAAVSGTGRPVTGTVDNALYWCFSKLAGRARLSAGLAMNPVFDLEDIIKMRSRVKPDQAALGDDVIRIHIIGTNALPEDSRINRPMIVAHIVDSSTGRYITKTPPPKGWASTTGSGIATMGGSSVCPRSHSFKSPARSPRLSPKGRRKGGSEDVFVEATEPTPIAGGATTTFEERTLWSLNAIKGDTLRTGIPCETVPPAATQPCPMTMRSSRALWEEDLVFAESYRQLLAPETVVLFELVDFAVALSRKEARKGGGVSKIAWGFLRPIGARGECNVGTRDFDDKGHSKGTKCSGSKSRNFARTSTLQLFEYKPLSVLVRWQARQRGFPRLAPPASSEVPDVFLQFLFIKRMRYAATLVVSVGPTPRLRAVWVTRRPMASHEREKHQYSYESLAEMNVKSREDREHEEAAGITQDGNRSVGIGGGAGASAADTARAEQAWAARTRRLRDKNDPCVLPDRLLHRVYAGQNGAITLAFSGTGSLLAAACCDDPLPGRFPIRLIDSETGRCRHELVGHASMVYSLVWSPGDMFLLSASADGTAKKTHLVHKYLDVRFFRERCGEFLVGVIQSISVEDHLAQKAWERRQEGGGSKDDLPELVCVLQHTPPCFVYAGVFQPRALDITRGATIAADNPPKTDTSECAFVVTGAYDRRLRLWDMTAAMASEGRAKMLGTLSNKVVHESHVNAIVYDAKNGRLYSGDGAGAIVVWRRSSGGRGGVNDYSVLRKVQHADLMGKAITSLALALRLRRGQLLVQAHGNTLRLLDLGTYQLVNPGFAGGAAAGSLVRASFSPDGRFVVSGSERGQVRVWEAQEGKRVRTPLQTLGTACSLRDVAWHPHQHVLALAGYGQDAPVIFYCGEASADKQTKGEVEAWQSPTAIEEKAAKEAQASAEEHRRRLENRQRLRELRIKRLRAKALGFVDGEPATDRDGGPESGVAAALAALTA